MKQRWVWWWMVCWTVTTSQAFLWKLFGGGNNCNCCRCPSTSSSFSSSSPGSRYPTPNFFAAPTLVPVAQYQSSYSYSYSPPGSPPGAYHPAPPAPPPPAPYPPPRAAVYDTVLPAITDSSGGSSPPSYPGPPASAPISAEQLDNERKYATNQVAYQSESRPLPGAEFGGLTELENELAAEKYKKQKEKEKPTKIKVFKIKPHKSSKVSIGMVEWQASQVAKYTNEKAQVDKFIEATSDTNESLEEFIPIEIGSEPEYADEEPAGPPPNVRNRISHDPVLINSVHRRRFIL